VRVSAVRLTALATPLLCFACSSPSRVTTDTTPQPDASTLGFTWQTIRHPDPSELFLSVWASAAGDVYAASEGDAYAFSVASSHDHGATWTVASVGDSVAPVTGVVGVGSSKVYAVGSTRPSYAATALPFVAISTDGGATFTPSYPPFGGGFNAVTADAAGNLLAVGTAGDGGFFARSTDGAATWTRAAVSGVSGLDGIWVAADGTIYACGYGTGVGAPGDGGGQDGGDQDGGGKDGAGGHAASGDAAIAGRDGGGDAGRTADGGAPGNAGVVIRSTDAGATWRTVATALGGLFAISGTPDQTRMVAVGAGYTNIEIGDGYPTWFMHAGDPTNVAQNNGDLSGVWVPDATESPYMTMGNSGYVVRGADDGGSELGDVVTSSEELPAAGQGLQSGAYAITGTGPDDVWAVGSGIFHRTMR
jgi:hypothetical protein